MNTPSERIWAQLDGSEAEPGLEAYLPAQARAPTTLAQAAERIGRGDTLREAVADFMDDLRFARSPYDIAARIESEPQRIDPRVDAYLGAVAEHVAAREHLRAPWWVNQPGRFLDHFWWPTSFSALRARTIIESPAAFRRRGIYIGANPLQRV